MKTHADALECGLMDIGRAAEQSGVSQKMIRHYEVIGLLPKVARTVANYRLYGPSDVHKLRFIKRARALGFSMKDIKELLDLWQVKSLSSRVVKRIAGEHIQELKRKLYDARAMAEVLEKLGSKSSYPR